MSVSISAKISPSFTKSPTFLFHLATVPSSIVSLNLGMFIISTPSGIELDSFSFEITIFSSNWFSFELFDSPFLSKSEISSPLLPIIASNVSTGAVPPSSIPI